jgi:CheY-like chemotaxis protein
MPKVLLVEDDQDILDILVDIVKRLKLDFVTANDGEAAFALFKAARPDMVMADIRMPKLDGIDLSAAIKKLDPSMPVVLFSGQYPNLVEDKLENKIECDHVLYKPFIQVDIVESLRMFLGAGL